MERVLAGRHAISRLCDGSIWGLYHEVWYIELVWSYQILHYCQGMQAGIDDVWELF